jgi:uncharacterized protein YdhG (YjbR/CyaY superfamily)
MAKIPFESVDDYILSKPEATRVVLRKVRAIVRKAVPAAEERISYDIPSYRLPGGTVIYFAGWKKHFSLYPATDGVVAAFTDELASYQVEKGTIRFPLDAPVPARLVAGIARQRAREVVAAAKAGKKRAKR